MWRLSGHLRRLISPCPSPSPLRLLSTTNTSSPSEISKSISVALSSSQPLDLQSHLNLHYSDVNFSLPLFREILSFSPPSRPAADFFRHIVRHRSFHPSDSALAVLIQHLSRHHDFKAAFSLLSDFPQSAGPLTHSALFSGLSKAGRPTQAIKFFSSLPDSHKNSDTLFSLVSSLSEHGFAGHAERFVLEQAHEIFPDEATCTVIIQGYASKLKLDDALRLLSESRNGGFELKTPAYNAILDCICRLARKKDPLSLHFHAEKFLVEMEKIGIPRDSETFQILITNLCKIRKTEDAMKLFREMGNWGCSPDSETYLVLIKSLYQAARVSEGDEMINFMKSAGFGDKLDRKAYYNFIKVLCGIERIEHAMKVLKMMKMAKLTPGVKTYSKLIEKLATHNFGDRANALFKEAVNKGVKVTPGVYKVDKRYLPKKLEEKKVIKKRPTLPEKMIMKSRRVYKLKRSFVRKSKSRMGRRYG